MCILCVQCEQSYPILEIMVKYSDYGCIQVKVHNYFNNYNIFCLMM